VVLGGGFAGASLAVKLASDPNIDVTLISRLVGVPQSHAGLRQQLQPRLRWAAVLMTVSALKPAPLLTAPFTACKPRGCCSACVAGANFSRSFANARTIVEPSLADKVVWSYQVCAGLPHNCMRVGVVKPSCQHIAFSTPATCTNFCAVSHHASRAPPVLPAPSCTPATSPLPWLIMTSASPLESLPANTMGSAQHFTSSCVASHRAARAHPALPPPSRHSPLPPLALAHHYLAIMHTTAGHEASRDIHSGAGRGAD
jgi:hypothetical protein